MYTAKDIMTRGVITCSEEDKIKHAANLMKENNIGSVVVVNKSPIGIVTERDMTVKVVAKNLEGFKKKVKDIMSSPIKSIDPETSVGEIEEFILKKKVKKMPVMKNGKLIGIVSQTDLFKNILFG